MNDADRERVDTIRDTYHGKNGAIPSNRTTDYLLDQLDWLLALVEGQSEEWEAERERVAELRAAYDELWGLIADAEEKALDLLAVLQRETPALNTVAQRDLAATLERLQIEAQADAGSAGLHGGSGDLAAQGEKTLAPFARRRMPTDEEMERAIAGEIYRIMVRMRESETERNIKGHLSVCVQFNIFPQLTAGRKKIRWWDFAAKKRWAAKWVALVKAAATTY